MTPQVSFIVPCYNYGRYLSDCLRSIFSQELHQDFEIIAIDDASTDHTLDVLADFKDARLRVFRHDTNRGHVATVNEGIAHARGAFVARIDPDDRYRAHFLQVTLDLFRRCADVGLVYGDAALIDDKGRINAECSDRVHGGEDFRGNEFLRLLELNCICAPTAIARRQLWEAVGPVPQGLAFNDWYFNVMMARHTDFYYTHTVLADYRVHGANHHTAIVKNKTEEPSVFSILDRVFAEQEPDPRLEVAKLKTRNQIYAHHYLVLGDKYFGLYMNEDARRCYLAAARLQPSLVLNLGVSRRLAGTVIGRRTYDFAKSLIGGTPMSASH